MRLAVVTFALLSACAQRPMPEAPTQRALYKDLERQVTVTAATGWGLDRLEIEDLLESALDSVCRVDPLARRSLREWIDAELRRLGGPVEDAYIQRNRDLDAVKDLLVLTRMKKLLARAEEASGECPFWIGVEEPFRGRQVSEGRWQLSFGGGGKGIAIQQGDQVDFSAGGAGRLMLGRTFKGGDGLYAGLELGASAGFPKDPTGQRTALVIAADVVAPVVYRRTLTSAFFEAEAGYLAHATEQDWDQIDHGFRVGFAFGARALRTRFFFPGAALGISYDRTFLPGDDLIQIKVGARVNFDLDL